MRMGRLSANFDLFTIISEMRQQRMAMVQTIEQYILCHRAVAALFMQQLQLIEFGANQSRCIIGNGQIKDDDNSPIAAKTTDDEADRSNQFDTSSSTAATDEQSSNSKCSFEQYDGEHDVDEDPDLGPVFI